MAILGCTTSHKQFLLHYINSHRVHVIVCEQVKSSKILFYEPRERELSVLKSIQENNLGFPYLPYYKYFLLHYCFLQGLAVMLKDHQDSKAVLDSLGIAGSIQSVLIQELKDRKML